MGSIGIVSRNLIKKHWAYNPQNSRIHIRNPNKGQGFLIRFLHLNGFLTGSSQASSKTSLNVLQALAI